MREGERERGGPTVVKVVSTVEGTTRPSHGCMSVCVCVCVYVCVCVCVCVLCVSDLEVFPRRLVGMAMTLTLGAHGTDGGS